MNKKTPSKKWYYEHVTANKEELARSEKCGCVCCQKIFKPEEIEQYVSDAGGDTAICPYCDIDAVVGDASGVEITDELLSALNKKWF
jgi:hypothetical protein